MNHYINEISNCSRRLLNLVDRDGLSPTFGCFDRDYWHFKTKSFPNAASQQGLLSVAKLYILEEKDNAFFLNPIILELIKGSIDYSLKIQNSDGSFDEWYPNERGAAGPTGYLCHTFNETYRILSDHIDSETKNNLLSLINKAANYLLVSREKHRLANHVAIAMLGLYGAYSITKNEDYFKRYNLLKLELKELFSTEGWSVEYDGADPGYQTGTLSFLSRIHNLSNCEEIKEMCLKSLSFIKFFCYPDGSFGGNIGARHTSNIFYHGIEYWNNEEAGKEISTWIKTNFDKHTLPSDHDDVYILYRIYELIDAHRYYKRDTNEKMEYKSIEFRDAGIRTIATSKYYFVVSLNRGGAFQIFDIAQSKMIDCDSGASARIKKNIYSSLSISKAVNLKIEKKMIKNNPKLFTPITQSMFFSFMTICGFNHRITAWIKYFIRSSLIVFSSDSNIKYTRSFVINENTISIETSIESSSEIDEVRIGGDHFSRYVPQSRYMSDLKTTNDTLYIKKQVLNKIKLKKVIDLVELNVSVVEQCAV